MQHPDSQDPEVRDTIPCPPPDMEDEDVVFDLGADFYDLDELDLVD